MRVAVILLIVFGVVFAVVRGKSRQAQDERWQREERAQQQLAKKQEQVFEERRAESERKLMTSFSCDTVISNRQVLHDAQGSGGTVISLGGGRPPLKSPEEIRAAFNEAQQFIDQNCADSVNALRASGQCSHPQFSRDLVCQQ